MSSNDNPLIKALPPAVDYLSYLTILEYNLTPEQLPLLHDILQDTTLTANIGWDLVHLLLPLLPQSQQCLQDVARLGNPREVVLKVTELLEVLATPDEEITEEEDEDEQEQLDDSERAEDSRPDDPPAGTAVSNEKNTSAAASRQAGDSTSRGGPSKVSQFSALLDMLAILHPRIKTKYPSRFLSTSLQAVLPAYATLVQDAQATDAVLRFINTFAGAKRPRLPPRKSSTQVLTKAAQLPAAAPDPEATEESLAPGETALKEKLLQSFLTFVAEGYMSSLPVDNDVPALSWSTRLLEHLYPEKNIPGRRTTSEAFEEDEALHRRDSSIGQMLVSKLGPYGGRLLIFPRLLQVILASHSTIFAALSSSPISWPMTSPLIFRPPRLRSLSPALAAFTSSAPATHQQSFSVPLQSNFKTPASQHSFLSLVTSLATPHPLRSAANPFHSSILFSSSDTILSKTMIWEAS